MLLRHRSALAAVTAAAFLVALAAASAPLVTTASASEALKSKLVDLRPLATGLEIGAPLFSPLAGIPVADLAGRRESAARRLAAELQLAPPVFTEKSSPVSVLNPSGYTQIILMARTSVLAHVQVVARTGGHGIWVSDLTASGAQVRPGQQLRLSYAGQGGISHTTRVRVKGIYRALDRTTPDASWANFLPEIFPQGLDPPPPVRYAFLTPGELYQAVHSLSGITTATYQGKTIRYQTGPALSGYSEMAVDPAGLTLSRARALVARFAGLESQLRGSALGRQLGCAPPAGVAPPPRIVPGSASRLLCSLSSSLSSAVALADQNASEISPVVTLLSGAGTLVALAVAAAAGLFLVRRRAGEAGLLFARGEHVLAFAARSAVEVVAPVLAGGAAGLGLAVGLTGVFAPSGSVDGRTVGSAAEHGALAAAGGLVLTVVVASAMFLHLFDSGLRRARRLRWVPWELPLLGVAAWLLGRILSGGGLAGNGVTGARHLTLPVFVVPLLLVAGAAGLVARSARAALRLGAREGGRLPIWTFLALRRLSAARGVLVALLVVSAVSFGAYLYAQALSGSLTRSVTEKSYIAFGGDAQGIVPQTSQIPAGLKLPVTKVEYANQAAALGGADGTPSDLLGIDPATFGSVIRWYPDWGADPRPLLSALSPSSPGPLPVVVTRLVPAAVKAIWVQGVRLPVRVVARVAAFPGMSSGIPLVVVSAHALDQAARRADLYDPLGEPQTYVWAKGPPEGAARVLAGAPLQANYVTTIRSFTNDPAVLLARRTFGYMRMIAIAAGVLVLLGLLLYLQARQRSQAVSSALAGRMGLRRRTEVLSLAFELGAIGLLAAAVGGLVALLAIDPIIGHVDPLPDNPPAPSLAVPLGAIMVAVAALVLLVSLASIVTSWVSRRTDMGEALRVV